MSSPSGVVLRYHVRRSVLWHGIMFVVRCYVAVSCSSFGAVLRYRVRRSLSYRSIMFVMRCRVRRSVPYRSIMFVRRYRVPMSMPAQSDNVSMINSPCSNVSTASMKTTIIDGSDGCRENERCLLPCRDFIHIIASLEHREYRVAVSGAASGSSVVTLSVMRYILSAR